VLIAEALSRRTGREIAVVEWGFGVSDSRLGGLTWDRLDDPVADLSTLARADVDPAHRAELRRLVEETGALIPPDWRQASEHRRVVAPRESDQPGLRRTAAAEQMMVEVFSTSIPTFGGEHARAALVPTWSRRWLPGCSK
jgi:hypothetical protein